MTCNRAQNLRSGALGLLLFAVFVSASGPAMGQYTARDRAQLEEAHRAEDLRARQDAERRLERARQNCAENRGVDCESPEGLREWLLLERSRAEALLDRIYPPQSSSAGASGPGPEAPRYHPVPSAGFPRALNGST